MRVLNHTFWLRSQFLAQIFNLIYSFFPISVWFAFDFWNTNCNTIFKKFNILKHSTEIIYSGNESISSILSYLILMDYKHKFHFFCDFHESFIVKSICDFLGMSSNVVKPCRIIKVFDLPIGINSLHAYWNFRDSFFYWILVFNLNF